MAPHYQIQTNQFRQNYSVSNPNLFITPPSVINNASIGSIYTRTIAVGNSGTSCIDTLHFFTIQTAASIQLNSMAIGTTTLTPARVSGDTLFYDVFTGLLPSANTLCNNGQSVVFTETIKLLSCNNITTTYGAAWGNGNSGNTSAIGKWCNTVQTTPISINVNTAGVANFTGYNYLGNNFVNMCTAFNYTVTYTTGGNAPMYNVTATNGLGNIYGGYVMDLNVYTINSVFITNSSNVLVPATFTVASGAVLGVTLSQYTTDPDGVGVGFTDLNGDGVYNDLPVGATFTLVINMKYNCNNTCAGSDNYIQPSISNGNLVWEDVCGASITGSRIESGIYNWGGNDEIRNILDVKLPANVIGESNFDLEICPDAFSWNYPASASGHYWEYKVLLPPGVTVNNAFYGSVAGYTVTGDTIKVIGSNPAKFQYLDCFKVNLRYTCGTSDTLKFKYRLEHINDITTNCRCRNKVVCDKELFTVAKCIVPCANGLTAKQPTVSRTDGSLGYTDYTLTNHVLASSLTTLEKQYALHLDTVSIKGTLVQSGSANNAFAELKLDKIVGLDVFTPELTTSSFKHYRAGVLLGAVNGLMGSNLLTLSTATTSIYRYDFSSNLIGGQLLNNDSIVVDIRVIVSINPLTLTNTPTILSGINWKAFNINSSTEFTCDNIGWIPTVYPMRDLESFGCYGTCQYNVNCGTSVDIVQGAKKYTSTSLFQNEYKPALYIDSVSIFVPTGYVFNSFDISHYRYPTSPPNQTVTPTSIIPVLGGNLVSFINDGSWGVPPIRNIIEYSHGTMGIKVDATCGAPASANLTTTVYFKDHYYAYSKPNGIVIPSTTGAAYYKSASIGAQLNYPSITKPAVTVTNLTGVVIGAKPLESFNIRVNSTGTTNAPNVWLASDGNPNITITKIVEPATSKTLTPNTYTVGAVNGSWFTLDTAGIASGTFKDYTVYFNYKSCTNDSIKLYSGWNCASFPVGNPISDVNACGTTPIYIKLNPQDSKFQLNITQNPKSPSINLCTNDTVVVVMNSVFPANVVNPTLTFTTNSGVNVSAIEAEYPLNSGTWQTIAYTSTLTPTHIYSANLETHTNIGSQGLLGTQYGATPEVRQVKLRVIYSADCNYAVGDYLGIIGNGYRVCDTTVVANSDNGGLVKSTDINITGLLTNGASASMDLSMIPPILTCTTITLPLTVTPFFQPTASGDLATYILPDGITYVPNSFLTGIPSATLSNVVSAAGTTTISILLPVGVVANSSISYSINVSSCGACKTSTLQGFVSKNYTGVTCNAVVCPGFSAVLVRDSVVVNTPGPSISINTASVTCFGASTGSVQVIPTNTVQSYSYSYTASSSTTNTATNLIAGSYTATVSDANNCLATQGFTITEADPLVVAITNTTQAGCGLANGEATVTATGGTPVYTYNWTNASNTTYTTSSNTTNSLSAGSNNITLLDANGCIALTSVNISNPNAPTLAITSTSVNCYGASTGTITTSVSGGSSYSYTWNTGAQTDALVNVPAGTYTVIVTDNNNCLATQMATITQPASAVTLQFINLTGVNCFGASNGSVSVLATGGTAGYTYSWQPLGVSGTDLINVAAGSYTLLVTDSKGCVVDSVISINGVSSALNAVLLNSVKATCEESNGAITVSVTGGTPMYHYNWNTGTSNDATLSSVVAGNYTVIVSDANGCKDTLSVLLDCKYDLLIPEIFSPNGDGKNDKFEIKAISSYPNNSLQIFNRWGSLVYSKDKYNNEWDGKANLGDAIGSALLPAGTYFVVIDFGDSTTETYKGYVMLEY